MADHIITIPWADASMEAMDLQRVKVDGELATAVIEERDAFRDGMLALLGPLDGPDVWECGHGVSVLAKCRKNCKLNSVRAALKLLPR